VLDRRPAPVLPPGATRIIGRPRIYKPHALLLACDESGVAEKQLAKRDFPEAFRELKRGKWDALQVWGRTKTDGE
jgi:ribosomal protein RSM22 (predicted rRNA methylase)